MAYLNNHMHRKFGFCVIQWKIKNFSLLSAFDTWAVTSPMFYLRGFKETRWKLRFQQVLGTNKEKVLLFQIKMICDDTASHLFKVECKLYRYSQSNTVYDDWYLIKQIYYQGVEHFSYEEEVDNDYFKDIKPFQFEDLLLKCELLVWFPKHPDLAPRCKDAAIQELSEDLLRLYESSRNFDVRLVIGENNPSVCIKAHKAILFARNPKFQRSIEANLNSSFFTLDRHNNLHACDRVLRFLYSADMENSAKSPRIAVHEIASIYDVRPLVAYFTPDQLSLHSTVEIEEFEVTWVIENFFDTERNVFNSPKIKSKNFDTSWEITLYPKSSLNENYVGLHVTVSGGWQRLIWIRFCLRNSEEEMHAKDMLGLVTEDRNFEDNMFSERQYLQTFFRNPSLTLIARFKVVDTARELNRCLEWSGDQRNVTGTSITKCLPYSEQKNYDQLFDDMSALYRKCAFRDMYFQIGGVSWNINRGLLSARCPVLYDKVCQGGVIDLRITNLRTVSRLISFLNCGNYYAPSFVSETFELYDAAEAFKLKTLQAILLGDLRMRLSTFTPRVKSKIHKFAMAKCPNETNPSVKSLLFLLYP